MGAFYRPELEKDNPIAPQAYVGPRRRLALARAASKAVQGRKSSVRKAAKFRREISRRSLNAGS